MFAKNKLRLLTAAALMACAAGPAGAQSAWQALARVVAPRSQQARPAQPAQDKKPAIALVSDPSVGVKHGIEGVKPNAELAALQVRSAISQIGNKLPNLAPTLRFGSEMEETTVTLAVNLFEKPEIRKLLGDSPRFVYDPSGKPDPMVVPWVRRAAIFKELIARADACATQGQIDQAVAIYQQILDMNDPRFNLAVQKKLAELNVTASRMVAAQAQQIANEKVELPGWVHDNTTGVLFEKNNGARNALCLVGEYMLRIGEPVPNYPEVTVAAIAEKSVTYRYRNHDFSVELNNQ